MAINQPAEASRDIHLLPGGYSLRPAAPDELDTVLRLRVAQNQADYQMDGLTASDLHQSWQAPAFHIGLDHWLVCAPDGQSVAYGEVRGDGSSHDFEVIFAIAPALNFYHDGSKTAWVDHLGVRRAFRRRGIGLALLLHTMTVFYRRGYTRARLSVDSHSLTHAPRLYEKAGFGTVMGYHVFRKSGRGKELTG
jgi:ribosomal protein S18 acetylase RimI-like enzyme